VFKEKCSLNKLVSYTILLMTTFGAGLSSNRAYSKEYFNPNALSNMDGLSLADLCNLEQFSTSGFQMPGVYHVNVVVNDSVMGLNDIEFILNDNKQLEPVFSKQMLTD